MARVHHIVELVGILGIVEDRDRHGYGRSDEGYCRRERARL